MKWYYKILIGAIIFAVVYLLYTYTTTEGFQTISNVQYRFNEVFLVAPNQVSEKGNPVPLYSNSSVLSSFSDYYKKQGYTYPEAEKICRDYGGDLATLDQLKVAYDNSGNWCPAGWIKDDRTNAYYLPSKQYLCGLSLVNLPSRPSKPPGVSMPKITAPVDSENTRRAFAICYAPKPAEPSISVNEFNDSRYSMIADTMLNSIMNASGSDIFPIPFTAAQAYYAIDISGRDTATNTFNSKQARDWLMANYERVDSAILATDTTYNDTATDWTTLAGVTQKSCGLIEAKDIIVSDQVKKLQDHFKDISGIVLSAIKSKTENAKIQSMLFDVCKATNPTASPACAKLATLDFDLFYTNPTHSTLADLETLNIQIYQRKNEVCGILYNIRVIKSALGCPYTDPIPQCTGCNIDTVKGIFDCSNSPIFDTSNIGGLRYSLEQISPLFDVQGYNELLGNILDKLSYVVETPSLSSFNASDANTKMIFSAINDVKSLINNEYASAKNDLSTFDLSPSIPPDVLYRTSTELF